MSQSPHQTPQRPSGRPVSIDPEVVARRALELFAARGYDAVSMGEIAVETGIARKSLYRYFESKPALVWGGLLDAVDVSGSMLQTAALEDSAILEGLMAASAAVVASLPDLEVTRGRLRLIANHPELMAHAPSMLESQRRRVHEYFLASGMEAERAHYLSIAHASVSFAAWLRWSRGDQPSPLPFLRGALEVLRF